MTWSTPINGEIPILPGILKLYNYNTAAFVSPSLWDYFGFSNQFQSYTLNKNMKNIVDSKIAVVQWLTNTRSPYFLFWNIYDVHIPFTPASREFYPKEYAGPFADRNFMFKVEKQTKGSWFYVDSATRTVSAGLKFIPKKPTAEDIRYLQASYDTGIQRVDNQLRLFFESIQNKPFFKDTLFIISSEHGEDLEEHGFIFHRDLYDVNIRIPLVFIYPSLKPQWVKEAVSSLDIMPTILHMLNIPAHFTGEL